VVPNPLLPDEYWPSHREIARAATAKKTPIPRRDRFDRCCTGVVPST
jgi:hypothetical protein